MSKSLAVTAYVRPSGPIADGLAASVIEKATDAIRQAVAKEAYDKLASWPMDKTGRSTGGFKENLRVLQSGSSIRVRGGLVTGTTWAPWLEGSSKRNQSTSFKGYHLFRKTRLEMDRRVGEIADREMQKYLPAAGGE